MVNITNMLSTVTELQAEALRVAAILEDEVNLKSMSSSTTVSMSLASAAYSWISEAISLVSYNFTATPNEVKGLLSEHNNRSGTGILTAQKTSIYSSGIHSF